MFSLSLAPLLHLSASGGQSSVHTYRDSQPEESGIGCESLYAGAPWRVPQHTSSDKHTAAVPARLTTQQHVDVLEMSSTSSHDVTSVQHSSTCDSNLTRSQVQSQRSAL